MVKAGVVFPTSSALLLGGIFLYLSMPVLFRVSNAHLVEGIWFGEFVTFLERLIYAFFATDPPQKDSPPFRF